MPLVAAKNLLVATPFCQANKESESDSRDNSQGRSSASTDSRPVKPEVSNKSVQHHIPMPMPMAYHAVSVT